MFGTTRKALFGAPMVEDAMAQVAAPVAAPSAAMVEPAAAQGYTPPKRSFLDRLDLVADAFSNNNNNAMRLQMQDREAFQNWQATAGQQQEDARKFAMFKQQADYERANPKPINNDTVNDYNFILERRGEAAANEYLDAVQKTGGAAAPQIMQIPGMGLVRVDKGPQAAAGGVPDGAVAMLKQNPAMAAQFDAKYGAGASARYLGQGGAAPQGGRTFPVR